MQVCRFTSHGDETPSLGAIDEAAGTVTAIDADEDTLEGVLRSGESWETLRDQIGGREYSVDDVSLRTPVERPLNLVGIGLNYAGHAAEGGHDIPEEPIFFAKSPSSITDPGAPIVKHDFVTDLHYEGEFGLVVGKEASGISPGDAAEHIFGFLAGNDVSARDMQLDDLDEANPWYRSKSLDTFTPLSPVTPDGEGVDPFNSDIETRLNGEAVQSSNTLDLIFDIPEILAYVSRYVTLYPGDVILTGTPAGVGSMEPGDRVEVDVEGVRTLANEVGSP